MKKNKDLSLNIVNALTAIVLLTYVLQPFTTQADNRYFNRIATFPVYLNTDINLETVAEIVDASKDGKTLVYTDSETGKLGFVDIRKPAQPKALGAIDVGGEPTSVAVVGDYALVAVNTSPSFVAPSGHLHVVDIKTQAIVATHPLAGQPDSVAVSPDERYAAVVIENERDEDLGNGEPPQAPSGLLQIIDLIGMPSGWAIRNINLDGIAGLFPDDAEPEYVDINTDNIAVVTMQENNHIVLIDLATGNIVNHFTAGTVDLHQIDTKEEDPALISLTDSLLAISREPDGVSWISNELFATADEGDLFGGSRGFTVFDTDGNVVFSSGNTLEHEVVRLGHYPDDRSKNKGNEPENVEFAVFGDKRFLFVASERSNVVFVYKVKGKNNRLEFVQTLPAGVGPEGIKAIPDRNLFVAASENDSRDDNFRSVITIYQLKEKSANYPTVISANRVDGTPIPWGALSGFAIDPKNDKTMYSVHDSFYQQSRIYVMNIQKMPAVIVDEIVLKDGGQTVNLDAEGVAVSASNDGTFWVASEGAGSVDDPSRPVTSLNLLVHVAADGTVIETITLPDAVNAKQRRFGFEGVASVMENGNEVLYVAFQRAWVGDPEPNNIDDGGKVRIGRYDTTNGEWTFAYYPLEVRQSPNGGWVGLSEITALGNGRFAVVERDNQGNTDARIKRVYVFSAREVVFKAEGEALDTVSKTLARDLLPDLKATGGMVLEKIESLAINRRGDMYFANDNDGVNDSNGETQLIRVKGVFKQSHHSHDFDYNDNDYEFDDDEDDDEDDDY
ncbi:MAG: esterase-like activity of phytase family protein [Burkholderiales bacterium]|nr:esterase-like activity of phytase family protein [Nitrosomonas sp.]MCP5276128.1 esterase-like activity of phytase family protein [Burkholderiales bacterium]